MEIVEHEGTLLTHGTVHASSYASDGIKLSSQNEQLISEYTLLIFINSKPAFKVVCTPTDLPELTAGRIITESGIDPSDIISIDICRSGNAARVTVKGDAASKLKDSRFPEVSTCCTDNISLLNAGPDLPALTSPVTDISSLPLIIQKAEEDTDLHKLTGSSHSSILMYEGKVIYAAEDIGRHNALDKAVGRLYIRGLDPSKAVLYTTGRMPVDMIRKVIRARIPVLISRQRPTVEGVELAARCNLRLIGNLRHDHYIIYA